MMNIRSGTLRLIVIPSKCHTITTFSYYVSFSYIRFNSHDVHIRCLNLSRRRSRTGFAKLAEKKKLRVLMDGISNGAIFSICNASKYVDSSIILEFGGTSAFAFMDWVQKIPLKKLKAVGFQLDNRWNSAIIAYRGISDVQM